MGNRCHQRRWQPRRRARRPGQQRVFAETLVSTLSEDDVKAKLTAEGYSKVHDVDFDDGVWKAEAERADGNDVEIHLDPKDGKRDPCRERLSLSHVLSC